MKTFRIVRKIKMAVINIVRISLSLKSGVVNATGRVGVSVLFLFSCE